MHSNSNDRETEIDNNMSGDDDSTPLLTPESHPLPVTVTHLSSKGRIEKVQLSSESSSVSPSVRINKESIDEKEIMIVDAPKATSTNPNNTNPFTNPFFESERNNSSLFDDNYDQITSILMNSTNPFHNPFLMPTETEVQEGQGVPSKLQVDDPGCTKTPLESVSLDLGTFHLVDFLSFENLLTTTWKLYFVQSLILHNLINSSGWSFTSSSWSHKSN